MTFVSRRVNLMAVATAGFDRGHRRNYRCYMKRVELKVARIGNSRGVRIPATTLARYHIGSTVVMEEHSDGILLRPRNSPAPKLSWEDTAREMEAEAEDWGEWDVTGADGLDAVPWEGGKSRRIAETTPSYRKPGRSRR